MSARRQVLEVLGKFLVCGRKTAVGDALLLTHLTEMLPIYSEVVGALEAGSARSFELYREALRTLKEIRKEGGVTYCLRLLLR